MVRSSSRGAFNTGVVQAMTGWYRLCPCGTTCTFWGRIYLCHPGLRWELHWKRSELSQWRLPKTSKQLCLQITQRESKLQQLYRLQECDISEPAVSLRYDFYECGKPLDKPRDSKPATTPQICPLSHLHTVKIIGALIVAAKGYVESMYLVMNM